MPLAGRSGQRARNGDGAAVWACPERGVKIRTKAKAEIWADKAKFNDYADKLQTEMTKLSAAAKTGSLDNIKAALGGVANNCKGCHDAFRKE